MENAFNKNEKDTVTYEKEKIELLMNILNSVSFTGIQQIQAIAQVSVILGNPVPMQENDDEQVNKGVKS